MSDERRSLESRVKRGQFDLHNLHISARAGIGGNCSHVDARKMIGKIISVEPILTSSRAYNSRQCPLENNCLPDSLVL